MKKNAKEIEAEIYFDYMKEYENKSELNDEIRAWVRMFIANIADSIHENNFIQELFENLSNIQIMKLAFSFKDNKSLLKMEKGKKKKSKWLYSIGNLDEYNFDKIINKKNYISLNMELQKISSYKDFNYENEIKLTKKIADLIEKIGNPIKVKRIINIDNNLGRKFYTDRTFSPYYELLKKLHDIYDNESIHFINLFPEIFLTFLSFTMDEMIRYIDVFFDYYLFDEYFPLNKNFTHDLIKQLRKINEDMNKNLTNTEFSVDIYYPKHITTHIKRLNIDNFFSELSFLKTPKGSNNDFSDLLVESGVLTKTNNGKILQPSLKNYITELEKYNSGTYFANKLILHGFDAVLDLNNPRYLDRGIPHLSIVLDLQTLYQANIIYDEFITLGEEHTNSKQHSKSKMNISIPKMMINIITTELKKDGLDIKKITKKDYKPKYTFDNDELFNENINEKENIIIKQTILFTEKIRRGFYRKNNLMNEYENIFDYIVEIRKTATSILKVKNLELEIEQVFNLYSAIKNTLDNLSIEIEKEACLTHEVNKLFSIK